MYCILNSRVVGCVWCVSHQSQVPGPCVLHHASPSFIARKASLSVVRLNVAATFFWLNAGLTTRIESSKHTESWIPAGEPPCSQESRRRSGP